MVSLHSQSDQSHTSVTRSESRRNVRRSGRVHSGRQLLGFHLGERYFRSESQLIMGSKCRTFLPNSRIIPLRLLHRQKAVFRYDGKESPFLDKDIDYLRNLFCSSLCSEIVSAKAIRIGKSTPTPEYACPSHSRADSNRKHLTTRRTTV